MDHAYSLAAEERDGDEPLIRVPSGDLCRLFLCRGGGGGAEIVERGGEVEVGALESLAGLGEGDGVLLPECGDQGDGHLLGGRSCESTEGRKGGPERQPAGQPEHAGGGGKEGHFVWGKEGEGRDFLTSQVRTRFIRAPTLRLFVHR